jgi:hypothetical protein
MLLPYETLMDRMAVTTFSSSSREDVVYPEVSSTPTSTPSPKTMTLVQPHIPDTPEEDCCDSSSRHASAASTVPETTTRLTVAFEAWNHPPQIGDDQQIGTLHVDPPTIMRALEGCPNFSASQMRLTVQRSSERPCDFVNRGPSMGSLELAVASAVLCGHDFDFGTWTDAEAQGAAMRMGLPERLWKDGLLCAQTSAVDVGMALRRIQCETIHEAMHRQADVIHSNCFHASREGASKVSFAVLDWNPSREESARKAVNWAHALKDAPREESGVTFCRVLQIKHGKLSKMSLSDIVASILKVVPGCRVDVEIPKISEKWAALRDPATFLAVVDISW